MTTSHGPSPAVSRVPEDRTERLELYKPTGLDTEDLHRLYSDERTWRHLPSGRFETFEQTLEQLSIWESSWASGLGAWVAHHAGRMVGHGGCALRDGGFWNLGYRFAPEAQGHGFASELSARAVQRARQLRPEVPVVAYLLEHNAASAAVARKTGLTQRFRGPDAGNPDPEAVRVVYADRDLTDRQLAAIMR
ncbi:GNAT family N-acetyltransferase [Curtobacterium sp. S6]|uniref:GNAT family N-acetyltransferase n=1 Tax=Curtobacterium sp. S6 TaxID=1479623 RepID=UPI0004AB11C1|nr:GNAT family N-acetyltransferase [Curtobacterium sp. S6]